MEAVVSPEMIVNASIITQCINPGDEHLNVCFVGKSLNNACKVRKSLG
jgi:hypothetical protein